MRSAAAFALASMAAVDLSATSSMAPWLARLLVRMASAAVCPALAMAPLLDSPASWMRPLAWETAASSCSEPARLAVSMMSLLATAA